MRGKGGRKIITSFNNEGGNEKEREREREKEKGRERRMNLNNVSKWWDFFLFKDSWIIKLKRCNYFNN